MQKRKFAAPLLTDINLTTMKYVKHQSVVLAMTLVATIFSSCEKDRNTTPEDPIVVITANGDISARMNDFRLLLGTQLNTTPGAVGGRREINWDAVPAEMLEKKLPENFFNNTEPGGPVANKRGIKYSTVGEFRVSQNNFSTVNAGSSDQFIPFSGDKSFTNISSNLWDVEFQVPGQNIAATSNGFGAVFTDVDKPNSSYLEFFNGDVSIGKFYVPAQHISSKFSFLGVYFREQKFTRVRVSHEASLSDGGADVSKGGTADLVVMDDFIYSEPVIK